MSRHSITVPKELPFDDGKSARYRGSVDESPSAVKKRFSLESNASLSRSTKPWAVRTRKFMQSQLCESIVGMVILANFIVLATEADERAESRMGMGDGSIPDWIGTINKCFLIFYGIEVTLRLATERIEFFNVPWNCLDLFIVVIGCVGEILAAAMTGGSGADAVGSVNLLRTFRTVRLIRAVRLLASFPELGTMIFGLAGCFKTLLWSAGLILVMLTIWSIIAVEYIQPYVIEMANEGKYEGIDCPWCPSAFESVMHANLTLFQIMTGDGWSILARPLIEKYPWMALYFVGNIFIMVFGMLNLITAVVVDTAARGRENDLVNKAKELTFQRKKAVKKLIRLCEGIDEDDSGTLNKEEFNAGFENSEEFSSTLISMDVSQEDLDCVFEILDTDGSNSISYVEFAENLFKMKTINHNTAIMLIKHHVAQVKGEARKIKGEVREQQQEVANLKRLLQSVQDNVMACNVQGMSQMQQLSESFAEDLNSMRAQLAAATGGPGCTPMSNAGLPIGNPNGLSRSEAWNPQASFPQQHGLATDSGNGAADDTTSTLDDVKILNRPIQSAPEPLRMDQQVLKSHTAPIVAMPGNAPVPKTPAACSGIAASPKEEDNYKQILKELAKVTAVLPAIEQMMGPGHSDKNQSQRGSGCGTCSSRHEAVLQV